MVFIKALKNAEIQYLSFKYIKGRKTSCKFSLKGSQLYVADGLQ